MCLSSGHSRFDNDFEFQKMLANFVTEKLLMYVVIIYYPEMFLKMQSPVSHKVSSYDFMQICA